VFDAFFGPAKLIFPCPGTPTVTCRKVLPSFVPSPAVSPPVFLLTGFLSFFCNPFPEANFSNYSLSFLKGASISFPLVLFAFFLGAGASPIFLLHPLTAVGYPLCSKISDAVWA